MRVARTEGNQQPGWNFDLSPQELRIGGGMLTVVAGAVGFLTGQVAALMSQAIERSSTAPNVWTAGAALLGTAVLSVTTARGAYECFREASVLEAQALPVEVPVTAPIQPPTNTPRS